MSLFHQHTSLHPKYINNIGPWHHKKTIKVIEKHHGSLAEVPLLNGDLYNKRRADTMRSGS
jgi:hypothetical protein